MSVYFQNGDDEVWNPSSEVAALFMQQVSALEKLVGHPSGLSPGNSDEVDIDADMLCVFLGELGTRLTKLQHRALLALVAPASQILCALYARCMSDEDVRLDMLPGFLEAGVDLIR